MSDHWKFCGVGIYVIGSTVNRGNNKWKIENNEMEVMMRIMEWFIK